MIQELVLAQKESQKETERMIRESQQEADRRLNKTDKQIKALAKQLGEHGNRLGQFVQEMVRPAVVDLFQDRKIPVHQ
ncbi:MAG: DUF3782 domain-containing protein, partial [Gammaproteobacteria bacterium SHHR-1]